MAAAGPSAKMAVALAATVGRRLFLDLGCATSGGRATLVVVGVVVVGGGGLAAGASEDHGGERRVKECLSPLPGAPNVGEWFVQGQVLSKGFEHWGLKHTRNTSRKAKGKTREARQWRHGEFTQVQATLRCKTLLLLV